MKEKILKAAVEICMKKNYELMTKHEVARSLDVSPALINHYYTSIEHLRDCVVGHAITHGVDIVTAWACMNNHPYTQTLHPDQIEIILKSGVMKGNSDDQQA